MQDKVPITPEPGRHGWAELLTLVGAVRRTAYDRTLEPGRRAAPHPGRV
jgi:hypothetical protein